MTDSLVSPQLMCCYVSIPSFGVGVDEFDEVLDVGNFPGEGGLRFHGQSIRVELGFGHDSSEVQRNVTD